MSPYIPPLNPSTELSEFSLPSAKRRKLESSSGDSWTVSPGSPSTSDSRIEELAARNFSEIPLSSYQPGSDLTDPDLGFLHRREGGNRDVRFKDTAYNPLFRQRLNPDGSYKKPSRYQSTSYLKTLHPFLQNAVDVQSKSAFTWNEETVQIEIQDDRNATGQFNIFATIAPNQPRVLYNRENHEIGLKTFRDHCIMVRCGPDRVFGDSHLCQLNQYRDLRNNRIPVAEIYNAFEAKNGCGFFLVEIVPAPFYPNWNKGASIESLSIQQWTFLGQIKEIFEKSYRAGIIPDLKPDNLRVRSNGELAITDLRERKISTKYLEGEFKKMLRSFNCEEGDEIYNYLNPIPKFASTLDASQFDPRNQKFDDLPFE